MVKELETKILSDGNTMPIIGLGTWKLEGLKCSQAVKNALELGYIHIDTAEMYGNEEYIGNALEESEIDREKLFLTSKVWPDNADYEGILAACEGSLNKLKTIYLDLYLLHWPRDDVDLEEVFRAFKKLIDENKVKSVGLSNFSIKHLKQAMKYSAKFDVPITVNQVEFHPGLYQKELLEFCKTNKILVTAYSPIGRGEVLRNEVLQMIAEKHDKTPAQISLKWLLQKGMVVIPKSSSKQHLKENQEIFDFELDKDDIDSIDALGDDKRIINPGWVDFD